MPIKTSTSDSLITIKHLTVCITTNCGKFLKKTVYRTTLPVFWETCMWVKKQQLEPSVQFSSVALGHVQLFATPWTAARQGSLSITNSRTCSNSCPSSQWCHPTISSSVTSFFSCLQSFPASGSFPVAWKIMCSVRDKQAPLASLLTSFMTLGKSLHLSLLVYKTE